MRISDWSSDVCSSDLKTGCGRDELGHGGLLGNDGSPEVYARCTRLCLRCWKNRLVSACGFGAGQFSPRRQEHQEGIDMLLSLAILAHLARVHVCVPRKPCRRSEEHTSELQSLMRISYAVFCLKKKKKK